MDRLPNKVSEFRRADSLCACLLALLALHVLYISSDLPFGSISQPGPGFFPISLSALLLALAAALFLTGGFRSDSSKFQFHGRVYHVGVAALAMAAYGVLLERIGFPILMALLLLLMFRAVGRVSWPASTAIALGGTATAFVLFRLLGVMLPVGSLWT